MKIIIDFLKLKTKQARTVYTYKIENFFKKYGHQICEINVRLTNMNFVTVIPSIQRGNKMEYTFDMKDAGWSIN